MTPHFWLTVNGQNRKTGPSVAVSTSSEDTCPPSCPLQQDNSCYAKHGKLRMMWNRISAGLGPVWNYKGPALLWKDFITAVKALAAGTLFRHNQAGDLPGGSDKLNPAAVLQLDGAVRHLRAWTYTHYPPTPLNMSLLDSLQHLVVNLSANRPSQAVEYANAYSLPVATVVPHDWKSQPVDGLWIRTCPAQLSEHTTCASCGAGSPWCARRGRDFVVGFRPEGLAAKQMVVEA